MPHLSSIINIIICIFSSSGVFLVSCMSSIISPMVKKQGVDSEILKKNRPVANLSFIKKIIEKAIAI